MADKIPMPREFLPHPGEPILPFKIWINLFDNYIFMKDSIRSAQNKMTHEEKNRFLFSLLGLEGIRIFSAQPMSNQISTANSSDFKKAVTDIFSVAVNPFRAYHDFEKRNQLHSETIQEYITALRSLMADCSFGDRGDYHLAVRLVCGCHNNDTQKKLLALPTVNLEEVIRILKADETAT